MNDRPSERFTGGGWAIEIPADLGLVADEAANPGTRSWSPARDRKPPTGSLQLTALRAPDTLRDWILADLQSEPDRIIVADDQLALPIGPARHLQVRFANRPDQLEYVVHVGDDGWLAVLQANDLPSDDVLEIARSLELTGR